MSTQQQELLDKLKQMDQKDMTRAQLVTMQRYVKKYIAIEQAILEKLFLVKYTLENEIKRR